MTVSEAIRVIVTSRFQRNMDDLSNCPLVGTVLYCTSYYGAFGSVSVPLYFAVQYGVQKILTLSFSARAASTIEDY
jgi:hypothetical protein